MEALWQSFLLVAVSEMGDKTQLLAIVLAVRYQKPWTILLGVFVATLLNHWAASFLGVVTGSLLDSSLLRWILAGLFFAFACWMLVPDKAEVPKEYKNWSVFLTTFVLFFLAEMGDKTQLATFALGANFQNVVSVTIGTTLGMLLTNALGIWCGNELLKKVSMKWMRRIAALLFAAFGLAILVGL